MKKLCPLLNIYIGRNSSLRCRASKSSIIVSGLTHIESSSGASGSAREGGAYYIKPSSKQYSLSMQQHRENSTITGATAASLHPQSELPSTEELNSRCGSRQSLLDSMSHRSRLSAAPAHQYSNAGCTSNVVPSTGGGDNTDNRNTPQLSPGK